MARSFFIIGLAITGCSDQIPMNKVDLWIDQPIDKMVGMAWPRNDPEGGVIPEFASIDKPAFLIIHLGTDKSLGTYSKVTFLSQRRQVLSRIVINPLHESASFMRTMDAVRSLAENLGAQNDRGVVKKIQDLRVKPPEWDAFARASLSCNVGKEINVYFEVKPADEKDKWIVSCTLLATRLYDLP